MGARLRVENRIGKFWGFDGHSFGPSHDVVLGRNGGSCSVSSSRGNVWGVRKMRCSRPTRVRGLHHQRGQPQVIVLAPGKAWRLLHIIFLMIDPLYRSDDPHVCSIVHIPLGKEASKVEAQNQIGTVMVSSRPSNDFGEFGEKAMKKTMAICFTLSFLIYGVASGQDRMNHDDGQKTYESQTPIQLAGTISDTGETFVSDQGGKSWTIINPDAVKGHKGEHVLLTANVDADKNEVNVVSIKTAKK